MRLARRKMEECGGTNAMAGAKKQSSKDRRAAGKRPRSAKERILRAIQYASACACLVFLAILIKNISDDMVSYEVQWENQQRLNALNALSASPTALGNAAPSPAAEEPTAEALHTALPSPSAAQGNMLAAFFGTPPVSTAAPAQDVSATVAPAPSPRRICPPASPAIKTLRRPCKPNL